MEKINFVNNNPPAINDTNLNQLQDNVESAINEVVEYNSNSNGHYIKYANGTLIQWKSEEVYDQAIATQYGSSTLWFGTRLISFPIAFYDANYVGTVGRAIWGTGGSWGSVMTNTQKYSMQIIVYDVISRASGTNFKLSWMAIGRWKA